MAEYIKDAVPLLGIKGVSSRVVGRTRGMVARISVHVGDWLRRYLSVDGDSVNFAMIDVCTPRWNNVGWSLDGLTSYSYGAVRPSVPLLGMSAGGDRSRGKTLGSIPLIGILARSAIGRAASALSLLGNLVTSSRVHGVTATAVPLLGIKALGQFGLGIVSRILIGVSALSDRTLGLALKAVSVIGTSVTGAIVTGVQLVATVSLGIMQVGARTIGLSHSAVGLLGILASAGMVSTSHWYHSAVASVGTLIAASHIKALIRRANTILGILICVPARPYHAIGVKLYDFTHGGKVRKVAHTVKEWSRIIGE